MGTFIFRLCIDNTLCLVTAFDKIEAEHMLRKQRHHLKGRVLFCWGNERGDYY